MKRIIFIIFLVILIHCKKEKDDEATLLLGAAILSQTTGANTETGENNKTEENTETGPATPSDLTFTGSPYTFKKGTTISTQTPTVTGTIINCNSNPTLPAGLKIDNTTCAISGTPTSSKPITSYTITASNSAGSTTTTISITVEAFWQQEAYLKAPNAESNDQFGNYVAISSDTVVVGAVYEDSNQTTITNGTTASSNNSTSNSGAVYVYKRSGTTWVQEAYVKAANPTVNDNFGFSLGIDTDTIVVGAWQESSNQTTITNGTTASSDDSKSKSGAVYVYKRNGTTWIQEAYIKAANADANDNFGRYVAIDSDTIVVGARYEDSNQTTITNGTTASTNNSTSASGAVYVYKRSGTTWAQEAYIKATNSDADDEFGEAVAIDSDTIVVGAYEEDSNQTTITNGTTASFDDSASGSGAVYVYKRNGTTWTQEAYLKASNADASDGFGGYIDISADTLAVGAFKESSNQTTITNGTTASADNSASDSGAVYVYKRSGTTWVQEAYIKASNADTSDRFGFPVAIDTDTLAVGAFKESSNQTTITIGTTASSDNSASVSGAVYVYKRNGTTWSQEAYLKASNAEAGDGFGTSLAISSGTVAVGAIFENSNQTTITNGTTASSDNSTSQSGAVYIFK